MKHLLVRYSDKFANTIEQHNVISSATGSVWFGKIGTALAERWIRILLAQVEQDKATYLFIVKRDGTRYTFHKAKLRGIQRKLAETDRVPSYYLDHALLQKMSCFFLVEPFIPCNRREVERIRLASSGSPATETLAGSMAGLFVVEVAAPSSGYAPH